MATETMRRLRVLAVATTTLLVPICGVVGATPAAATTISVTPGAVDTVQNGNCSLLEAIVAANTDQAVDACTAGAGSDVISAPGTYVLTAVNNAEPGAFGGPTGLPVVTSTMTIQGPTIVRSADASPFRILRVAASGNLTLSGASVSGGRLSCGGDCTAGFALGGGVLTAGTFSAVGTQFRDNTAECLVAVCSARGGGIYVQAGRISLVSSSVTGNLANCPAAGCDTAAGGALFDDSGTLAVSGTQIADNRATCSAQACKAFGGGILNNATGTVDSSSLTNNSAICSGGACRAQGGAIHANRGSLSLTSSQVTGNKVACGGTSCAASGGGIFKDLGSITVSGGTVVGNVPQNCSPPASVPGCTG